MNFRNRYGIVEELSASNVMKQTCGLSYVQDSTPSDPPYDSKTPRLQERKPFVMAILQKTFHAIKRSLDDGGDNGDEAANDSFVVMCMFKEKYTIVVLLVVVCGRIVLLGDCWFKVVKCWCMRR